MRPISFDMRHFLALLVVTTPAAAWEYSAVPVCSVSHQTENGAVELTYDPSRAEPYAITVSKSDQWAPARIFGLRFKGGAPLTITTDRHVIDGQTLTVRDQGFGNVLNGLEFSQSVTAFSGDANVTFSLEGAAPEIERFRACLITPIA